MINSILNLSMIERTTPVTKLKSILSLLTCTLPFVSCVTGGSGSQGTTIASVVIFSHLVSSAQNGDTSAKKAWCEGFDLVQSELKLNPPSDPAQDSAIREKLIPDMNNIMRSNGYQLHHQQISMAIQDALNVSRSEAATKETIASCTAPSNPNS